MSESAFVVSSEAALRDRYLEPTAAVRSKDRGKVDPKAAEFIAACPLVVLATADASGADASPRGGPPGFVRVIDPNTLAFADLSGNNRLDSYSNIVSAPEVGMLFLVPGVEETLRVNGVASVSTDPDVLDQVAFDSTTPKVAVVVGIRECYIHCGKAIRRSGVWDPASWPDSADRPDGAEVIVDQFSLDVTPSAVAADLEVGYRTTLWEPGGQ